MAPPASLRDYLTVTEAAKALQVTAATIRNWVQRGELAAQKTGAGIKSRYRISKADVQARLKAMNDPSTVSQVAGQGAGTSFGQALPADQADSDYETALAEFGQDTENRIKVAVIRTKPTREKGYLQSYDYPITRDEIRRKFGGGSYRVEIISANGKRTVSDLDIPGTPRPIEDVEEEDGAWYTREDEGDRDRDEFEPNATSDRNWWRSPRASRQPSNNPPSTSNSPEVVGQIVTALNSANEKSTDTLSTMLTTIQSRAEEDRKVERERAEITRREADEKHRQDMERLEKRLESDRERQEKQLQYERERDERRSLEERGRMETFFSTIHSNSQMLLAAMEKVNERREKDFMAVLAQMQANQNAAAEATSNLLNVQFKLLDAEKDRERAHIQEIKELILERKESEKPGIAESIAMGAASVAEVIANRKAAQQGAEPGPYPGMMPPGMMPHPGMTPGTHVQTTGVYPNRVTGPNGSPIPRQALPTPSPGERAVPPPSTGPDVIGHARPVRPGEEPRLKIPGTSQHAEEEARRSASGQSIPNAGPPETSAIHPGMTPHPAMNPGHQGGFDPNQGDPGTNQTNFDPSFQNHPHPQNHQMSSGPLGPEADRLISILIAHIRDNNPPRMGADLLLDLAESDQRLGIVLNYVMATPLDEIASTYLSHFPQESLSLLLSPKGRNFFDRMKAIIRESYEDSEEVPDVQTQIVGSQGIPGAAPFGEAKGDSPGQRAASPPPYPGRS